MQASGDELPFGASEYNGHGRHVVLNMPPTVVEYVPASQLLHATDPTESLYFPATQAAVHNTPSGPEKPAMQLQFITVELPGDDVDLDGQLMHATDPAESLYFPASHAAHVPPRGPE